MMANQMISFTTARRFAPRSTARFARRGGAENGGRSIVVEGSIIVMTDSTLLMRWGSFSSALRVDGIDSSYSTRKEGMIEFGSTTEVKETKTGHERRWKMKQLRRKRERGACSPIDQEK